MNLTIVKIGELLYSGLFKSIILPTQNGEIEILPEHTPIMSVLKKGKIKYVNNDGEEKEIKVIDGFVEVNKKEVLVIL